MVVNKRIKRKTRTRHSYAYLPHILFYEHIYTQFRIDTCFNNCLCWLSLL